MTVKKKFWLQKRGSTFYAIESETGRKQSLRRKDEARAERLLQEKSTVSDGSAFKLSIAKIYLHAADPKLAQRTWQTVFDDYAADAGLKESTRERRKRAMEHKAYDPIRNKPVLETSADDLRDVLKGVGAFGNACSRNVYNLARGMGWLPWEIIPPKLWPVVAAIPRRAVTRLVALALW